MIKYALFAAVALAMLSPIAAHAEKQVVRTVKEISDFPELAAKAKAVCDNPKLAKSDKLVTACKAEQWPSVTKAGAFRNSGIGAELNSLMRQGS